MKANRNYTQRQSIEFLDITIPSNRCTALKIRFTIDAKHILLAIVELLDKDKEKATRKMIEDKIRQMLSLKGRGITDCIDIYQDKDTDDDLREKIKEALPLGEKLFPEFFGVSNAVRFINNI